MQTFKATSNVSYCIKSYVITLKKFILHFSIKRVKNLMNEGLRKLNILNQETADILKQAELTTAAIFEFHTNNPSESTSRFIRKLI